MEVKGNGEGKGNKRDENKKDISVEDEIQFK